MPRTTRRSEPSPTPESAAPMEDERPSYNGVVEKVDHAAHQANRTLHSYYRKVQHYIPRALKHRTWADYYLLFYNTLTLCLWSFLAVTVIAHLQTTPPPATLLSPSSTPNPEIDGSSHKATAQLGAYLQRLIKPLENIAAPRVSPTGIHLTPAAPPTFPERISSTLYTLVERARTTYTSRNIGLSALLIQSLAALEPVHAYLRLTKSPVGVAASQVFSRLLVIWYFVESSTTAQSSAWYASMLLAWSSAELLRSTYYILSLLHFVPPSPTTSRWVSIYVNAVTTLRYTAFYVLYPLGAGSEYALMLKGFPSFPTRAQALRSMGDWAAVVGVSDPPAWRVLVERVKVWVGEWTVGSWVRVPFTVIWPASLAVLMMYMHQQRVKALGKGPGRSIPGGRLRDVGGKKRA